MSKIVAENVWTRVGVNSFKEFGSNFVISNHEEKFNQDLFEKIHVGVLASIRTSETRIVTERKFNILTN